MTFQINGCYNRERRHSKIGFLSPIYYEQCTAAPPYTKIFEDLKPVHETGVTPGCSDGQAAEGQGDAAA